MGENINSVNNDRDIRQEDDIVYTTDLTHTKLSRQIPIQQVSASHHSPSPFNFNIRPTPVLEDETERLSAILLQRHQIAWLNAPNPALGNLSPKQALIDPRFHSEILFQIKQIEQSWQAKGWNLTEFRTKGIDISKL